MARQVQRQAGKPGARAQRQTAQDNNSASHSVAVAELETSSGMD